MTLILVTSHRCETRLGVQIASEMEQLNTENKGHSPQSPKFRGRCTHPQTRNEFKQGAQPGEEADMRQPAML